MANWFDNVLDDPAHRQPPLVIHGHGKTLLIRYLIGYYHDRIFVPVMPTELESPFNGYLMGRPLIVCYYKPKVLPGTSIYSETLRIHRRQVEPIAITNETSWIIESPRRIDYCENIQLPRLEQDTGYPSLSQAYELGKQHRLDGIRLTARYVRSVLKCRIVS